MFKLTINEGTPRLFLHAQPVSKLFPVTPITLIVRERERERDRDREGRRERSGGGGGRTGIHSHRVDGPLSLSGFESPLILFSSIIRPVAIHHGEVSILSIICLILANNLCAPLPAPVDSSASVAAPDCRESSENGRDGDLFQRRGGICGNNDGS